MKSMKFVKVLSCLALVLTGLVVSAAETAGAPKSLQQIRKEADTALRQNKLDSALELAALGSVEAGLQVQQGDRATVRLRYVLAGSEIDTVVAGERIDGRWYLSDFLRHAREAAGDHGAPPAPPPPQAPAAPPEPVAAP